MRLEKTYATCKQNSFSGANDQARHRLQCAEICLISTESLYDQF